MIEEFFVFCMHMLAADCCCGSDRKSPEPIKPPQEIVEADLTTDPESESTTSDSCECSDDSDVFEIEEHEWHLLELPLENEMLTEADDVMVRPESVLSRKKDDL